MESLLSRRMLVQASPVPMGALQPPGGPGSHLKLSVRVEPLFRGMTLPDQMRKVAEAGYQGFEFGDWRAYDPTEITKLAHQLHLECACLVGNRGVNPKGMGLTNPLERDGFLAEIAASIDAAKRYE